MTQIMINTLEKKYGKLSYNDKKIDVNAGLRQSTIKKVGYKRVLRLLYNYTDRLTKRKE